MLLYPVYALLFADAGLSTAEISSLFAIWSITGFVLEVPSGVWADAVSRRVLLALAPLLSGAGFALWVITPSYPAFAAGFVLWGIQSALQSGALEALVYEELDHAGAADRYAHHIGRASAAGTLAATLAIGLAAPVFAAGGFATVGIASALSCVAAAAVGAGFPEHRGGHDGAVAAGLRRYAAIVGAGVGEVRSSQRLRAALLLVPAVTAIWGALDEYVPLLADETGAAVEAVPLLFLLVYLGVALGGVVAGRAARLSTSRLAGVLAAAATALAIGAASGVPAGFTLIGAAFAAFQAVTVAVDARLQDAINSTSRATVTSLAALATEIAVLLVFAGYGAGSTIAPHSTLFVCFASLYFVIAVAMLASARRSGREGGRDRPIRSAHRAPPAGKETRARG